MKKAWRARESRAMEAIDDQRQNFQLTSSCSTSPEKKKLKNFNPFRRRPRPLAPSREPASSSYHLRENNRVLRVCFVLVTWRKRGRG